MASGSRSKKLPQLADYVRAQPAIPSMSGWEAFGCLSSLGLVAAGIWMIRSGNPGWGWGTVAFGFPGMPIMGSWLSKHFGRPRTEDQVRTQEARQVIQKLRGYLDGGRLHRHLEPVAAALLEQGARNWCRIRETLGGDAWTDPQLPQHWKDIRSQSLSAADRAMEDQILLLRSSIKSQPRADDWQIAFTEFLNELLGRPSEAEDVRFPVEFEPAREIGSKLGRLASEVEEASKRLLTDGFAQNKYSSGRSIDAVLGELRAIQEAESELGQETRG